MQNTDSHSNLVTHKVEINLNMIGTLMLDQVGGHVHGADIVVEDNGDLGEKMVKFMEKLVHPSSLGDCIGNSTVFSLSAGVRDYCLAFGRPGHQIVAKVKVVIKSRTTCIWATSSIFISVGEERVRRGRSDP